MNPDKKLEQLEDPHEDYVPALDEMVQVMQDTAVEGLDDYSECDPETWEEYHSSLDQSIRDLQESPKKRHCFKCERWVSFGLGDPEGEDPRCPQCRWQICICGACGCNYRGLEP